MILVFVVIFFTRTLSTGGVITGDDKHVLLLYNTRTLSAGVTAEDNRGVCCTKYDGGLICRSSYMR